MPIDWISLSVFVLLFVLITVLGFLAGRWRRGDLDLLHEWGLAGGAELELGSGGDGQR